MKHKAFLLNTVVFILQTVIPAPSWNSLAATQPAINGLAHATAMFPPQTG